jgi:hypothetical protein
VSGEIKAIIIYAIINNNNDNLVNCCDRMCSSIFPFRVGTWGTGKSVNIGKHLVQASNGAWVLHLEVIPVQEYCEPVPKH